MKNNVLRYGAFQQCDEFVFLASLKRVMPATSRPQHFWAALNMSCNLLYFANGGVLPLEQNAAMSAVLDPPQGAGYECAAGSGGDAVDETVAGGAPEGPQKLPSAGAQPASYASVSKRES
jgi:hypothetical protein